jgi:hypothetical protein
MTEKVEAAQLELGAARELLEKYLNLNQYSNIEERDDELDGELTKKSLFIKSPWGDSTIDIRIPENYDTLFDTLNNVLLPERFAAIWHVDTKSFEIIYTAFPLRGHQEDVAKRAFTFSFEGDEYECQYGKSSDRLLTIAEYYVWRGMSSSNHRNLQSFQYFVEAKKGSDDAFPFPEDSIPTSLWIRNLEWDQEKAVELAMHLNFYMSYFDTRSPTINIFPPKEEKSKRKEAERYIAGYFPAKIVGRQMNANLLHYWSQSNSGDPFRRFLYAYQIVEYTSFYFVEESAKHALRKALARPHIHHELDGVIVEIMDSLSETKNWEGAKMQKLLKATVDPKIIWKMINENREYFSKPQDFDGGFRLRAVMSEKETEETFCHNWEGDFCKILRDIRNALSHGKEQTMSSVITPTVSNFEKFLPWVAVASLIAGEVMVYRSASI